MEGRSRVLSALTASNPSNFRVWTIVNSDRSFGPVSLPQAPNPNEPAEHRVNCISVFFGSLIAMLPWPLFAISLCMMGAIFEQSNDFMLLFGGVTLIFLIPLGLFDPPEWAFMVVFAVVWVLVLAAPALLVACGKLTKGNRTVAYVLQGVFSAAQAGLGFLMIVGRGV